MAVTLEDDERKVLEAFVALDAKDPGGAWNSFYGEVVTAADDIYRADMICRSLRRRKLLAGQGRGKMASYWPTDAGKEVVRGDA